MEGNVNVVFLNGVQNSGKSTQGKILAEYGFVRVVASDVLRERHNNDPDYAQEVDSCQSSGVLVPDEITIKTIVDYLKDKTHITDNLVLDGCMRTPAQAKKMIEYCRNGGYELSICFLYLDEDSIRSRAEERGRHDDNPLALRARLEGYYQNLGPVLATIVSMGCSIHSIDASLPFDTVHKSICEKSKLNLRKTTAVR